jgi:hypothetical protein
MNPDALAKRARPATLTYEELVREPKKAKLHADHYVYVPLDFFRQAMDDPSMFLEPTKATSESGSKEEKASSSTTGDEDNSTAKPAASATSESVKEKTSSPANALSTGSGGQLMSTACSVTGKEPTKRFGLYSEALLRDCYMDLMREINEVNTVRNERIERDCAPGSYLIEIRGSAGIGKSAFLAFLMARQRKIGPQNFALFHAPKEPAAGRVTTALDQVLCSVWIDGELKMDGEEYGWESRSRSRLRRAIFSKSRLTSWRQTMAT